MDAAAFEGEWRVARVIHDRTWGPEGRFGGIARFVPVAGGLDYREEGELRLGTAVFRATREYRWSFDAAGVAVFFADGRFFHAFGWDRGEAEHLCGEDLYRVRFALAAWPRWATVWEVRGPRKDYVMRTTYLRAA